MSTPRQPCEQTALHGRSACVFQRCMLDLLDVRHALGQESEKALRAEQELQPTVLDWLADLLCCCSKREGH